MKKLNKDINPNSVNGSLNTESGRGVALGSTPIDQVGIGLHQTTDPGCSGYQAHPELVREANNATGENINEVIGNNAPRNINKRVREKRNQRRLREILSFEDVFKTNSEPYYQKIINLTFPGIDISSDLNVIKASKELEEKIGKPERIVKSNRNTLLIEVKNRNQGEKLLKINKLAGKNTEVKPHPTLNTVRGVIRSQTLGACTEEEIVEHLSDQGVLECRRHKIKKNGEWTNTDMYFITFALMERPQILKITDWHHELVEEYKEKPRQCINCYKYGHVAKHCRKKETTCMKCGQDGHRINYCPNTLQCLHCKNKHYANDRTCQKYKIEMEIISTQIKEKTSKVEATRMVLSTRPDGGRLYRDAATQNMLSRENYNHQERDNPEPTIENNQDITTESDQNHNNTAEPTICNTMKPNRNTRNKENANSVTDDKTQNNKPNPFSINQTTISKPDQNNNDETCETRSKQDTNNKENANSTRNDKIPHIKPNPFSITAKTKPVKNNNEIYEDKPNQVTNKKENTNAIPLDKDPHNQKPNPFSTKVDKSYDEAYIRKNLSMMEEQTSNETYMEVCSTNTKRSLEDDEGINEDDSKSRQRKQHRKESRENYHNRRRSLSSSSRTRKSNDEMYDNAPKCDAKTKNFNRKSPLSQKDDLKTINRQVKENSSLDKIKTYQDTSSLPNKLFETQKIQVIQTQKGNPTPPTNNKSKQ